MKGIFLWPDVTHLNIVSQLMPSPNASRYMAQWLEDRFPGSHPVIVSSGRAAITLCLSAINIKRPDHVGIAPYSSACIFRSVGEVATPVPGDKVSTTAVDLLYHQWGFEHTSNATGFRINDSVDSLFSDNKALFSNGARFEIVSFAKILGVPVGAVIFCATAELRADLLQVMHNRHDLKWPQYLLRLLAVYSRSAFAIWNQTDNINITLPNCAIGAIARRLKNWDALIKEREEKMSCLQEIIPSWLSYTPGRLPTAVPVELTGDCKRTISDLGFIPEIRHYNASGNQSAWDLKKVFPFPIHHEVPVKTVMHALKALQPFIVKNTGNNT
jgi:putative PLP-dependent aminotransferase (TIGR04422 family)